MILLIDNYDSFTYNCQQQLARLGAECQVVRNDAITLDAIRARKPQALVFSPGPGKPEAAGIMLSAIQAFADTLPMLGICLGHQAIAQALGGRVSHANPIMHGKTSVIEHQQQGLFAGLPPRFEVGRYHSLHVSVEDTPACFTIDAKTSDGINMAIRHRDYPLFGLQFHPESILTPLGDQIILQFLNHIFDAEPSLC